MKDTSTEPFDREYMTNLFDIGYQFGRKGYRWKSEPPAF